MQSDDLSRLLKESLLDPEVQQLFQEELFKPLLRAAADPSSQIHRFLLEAGTWLNAHRHEILLHHEEFQRADAQAQQLLAQMGSFNLRDFLSLDPISPFALLMVAHKIQEQAGADANLGQTMRKGRKKGALGPVAKAVARYLKKHPAATTAEVWKSLSEKPPKDMGFFNSHRGQYIECYGPGMVNMTSYKRFSNIVSDQRKAASNAAPIPE